MKLKRIVLVLFLFFLAGVLIAGESEYFVKTLPVTKVYPHRKGFKVVFAKSNLTLGEIYIPMAWFTGSGIANKAVLMYGNDRAYPYCSIFWKKGEFDHIRLYVMRDKNDPSWGVLSPNEDLTKFDTDTLEPEF